MARLDKSDVSNVLPFTNPNRKSNMYNRLIWLNLILVLGLYAIVLLKL